MSILTRYICRRLIFYYLVFTGSMLVFFVFVDFMEQIEIATRYHAPPKLIALYYACYLPRIATETSWVAFLVSMLFVLGSLAKNNELTAMLAGGISIYRVAVPTLVMGALLSAGVFCMQEFVVPRGMLLAHEIKENDFSREPGSRTLSDVAHIEKRNRFCFFDVVDIKQGLLTGVHIQACRDGMMIERVDAERAVWDEESGRWWLENGTRKEFGPEGVVTQSVPFSKMKAPFKESPTELKMYSSGMGQLSVRQLRNQIKNLEKSGYTPHRLKVKYYTKFSLPLANVVVVLLALPFALVCRRGGLAMGFALSLMVALLYYGTFQMGIALGKGGSLPAVVSAWMANFLFLGIGAALTMRART